MPPSQNDTTSTTSSLRPRTRRLISVEDGDGDGFGRQHIELSPGPKSAPLAEGHSSSSAHISRAVSPSGSTFGFAPSATTKPSLSRSPIARTSSPRKWGISIPTPSTGAFLLSPKYWEESWSSLQGVASTILGAESSHSQSARSNQAVRSSKYSGPKEDEWGPAMNVENHIAVGPQEDRLAEIQARKRQTLLTANGNGQYDTRGRHKRKMSVDNSQATVVEDSEDALVYVHPVQPTDTVMGIAIKYGCQETVVRKANRLWANDSMQLRRLAYIPVTSCTVRGQKISDPQPSTDFQRNEARDAPLSSPSSATDWSIPDTPKASQYQFNSDLSPSLSSTTTSHDTAPAHIHESWVQISGFPTSTEVARLPRRTLGFFPPARRKSIPYHDATSSSANSTTQSVSDSPPRNSKSAIPPSLQLSPAPRPTLTRSASSLVSPNTIAKTLRGPGGVGTLGSEARAPGPAQDGLNAFFATHFPNAAPPLLAPASAGFYSSRSSFESSRSGTNTPGASASLEQIGGKVETWVRKIASKGVRDIAIGSGSGSSRRGSASQLVNAEIRGDGDGDLIELMGRIDSTAIDDTDDPVASPPRSTPDRALHMTSARSDQAKVLRERFPAGGRVFDSVTTG